MIKRYRKKPVIIEAIQFKRDNIEQCIVFTDGNLRNVNIPRHLNGVMTGTIETLESQHGLHTVQEEDYIIKGVQGEFYPCKPDIFKQTYEMV